MQAGVWEPGRSSFRFYKAASLHTGGGGGEGVTFTAEERRRGAHPKSSASLPVRNQMSCRNPETQIGSRESRKKEVVGEGGCQIYDNLNAEDGGRRRIDPRREGRRRSVEMERTWRNGGGVMVWIRLSSNEVIEGVKGRFKVIYQVIW